MITKLEAVREKYKYTGKRTIRSGVQKFSETILPELPQPPESETTRYWFGLDSDSQANYGLVLKEVRGTLCTIMVYTESARDGSIDWRTIPLHTTVKLSDEVVENLTNPSKYSRGLWNYSSMEQLISNHFEYFI